MRGYVSHGEAVYRWAPLWVGAAAVLALYAPTVPKMAGEWVEFPSLSHGFAIPLIAGYLIWRRKDRIAQEAVAPSALGLVPLVLGLALLVLGSRAGEPFLARLSLPPLLLGTVLFLAGPRVIRHAWMGIAYLLFMIPLPYVTLKALTYQSQLFDAAMSAEILTALGVPVFREGVFLHLANMTLEVAAVCSSVPAIAALTALGAAFGQLNARPVWVQVVLVLAAAPLGLASNLVRIVTTAIGAYFFGRIALDNVVHLFNGTTVFLATFAQLMLLDVVLMRVGTRVGR